MSITGDIHFSDGSIMKEVKTTQYLGAKITQKAYAYSEINHRIGIAIRTARILNNFWKGTNIPIKWKLQVYNAVLLTQLSYALNTVYISDRNKIKIATFHIKGLRKMLRIQHSSYSHITNEEVIARANKMKKGTMNIDFEDVLIDKMLINKDIRLITDFIQEKTCSLLGHVIRADNNDPMRQCMLDPLTNKPIDKGKKRVGGPRHKWPHKNMEYIYESFSGKTDFDMDNKEHLETILTMAYSRMF